jgi:hypothetical protein
LFVSLALAPNAVDFSNLPIPLDKEQYSSNLNTSVETSQDEDEDAKVEQSIMSVMNSFSVFYSA